MFWGIYWAALGIIIYTYLLFPILTFIRGRLWRTPVRSAEITPRVSLIIAAYNEAQSIGAKLDNVLTMVYPRDKLEVIVASDGSTDGTDEIVRQYAKQGIRLLSLPRGGKAPALNAAVAAATGEILVFSDANSMYASNAIQALARPFADSTVGGVAGNQVYVKETASHASGSGEQSYWNFDRKLKQSQSKAGNAISATGAIYAIRRALFAPVPGGVTDDFTISTGVITQGYRLVFAPDAIAYEPVAGSGPREFGRKVRITTRGLRAVLLRRELLNPLRYGFYAFQLFSHKVLRRLVVIPLLLLFLVNWGLWNQGWFYQATLLAQVAVYGCALLGWRLSDTRWGKLKLFSIPFFFGMVNLASLLATWNIVRGHRIERWEPQRREDHGVVPSTGLPLPAAPVASSEQGR
ncbi:MAG: glycosyltransferase family 2 protein [Caldilineaceae bacterium]|nr:glycosyltransferase family 2 protein [Caldilineaceae bacterium]